MKYNIFYNSNDTVQTEAFYFQFSVAGAFTPAPQGVLINVGTLTATTQYVGQNVIVSHGSNPDWYGVITYITDSTHIFVVPYQSAADETGDIFVSYDTTTTVTSTFQTHTTLSIDLTSAPDPSYNYIIVSSMSITGTDTTVIVRPEMRSACSTGDPFYHDKSSVSSARFQGRLKFANGSYTASRETLEDTYLYNTVHSVTLYSGNVYEFHLGVNSASVASPPHSVWMRNGRIMAFRVNTFQEIDNSTDGTGTTSSAGSWVSAASFSLTSTDDYMFLFSCMGKHGSTSLGGCQLRFRVGATTYADTTFLPVSTNNFVSFGGWIKLDGITSTTVVQLEVNNNGSDTATLTNPYICAIPLSAQRNYGFDYESSGLLADNKTTDTDSTATLNWNEGRTSASVTQVDRKYIEVITTNVRKASGDARTFARPYFKRGVTAGCAERGYVGPGMQWNGFWFQRTNPYLATSTTNGIETRAAVSDGNNVKIKNSFFLFLPEYEELNPDETTETTIIVEMESGLQFKSWNTHTADVYKRQILDIKEVSRILSNLEELTELDTEPASTGDWAAVANRTWFWDATHKIIYVKTTNNPSNDDQTLIVVALDRYSRTNEILYDTDGTLLPYESRLSKVPGFQQEVEARGTDSQVSTTLGSIVLPASDREFDQKITRRIYEGLRATVRRGYSSLSKDINTFHVIGKGIMGMPKLDEGKFEIKLYDTGLLLKRALDDTVITVYRGATQSDGQTLPILYGTLKRVPAYRLTNEGSGQNLYKISANPLKSIDAVYLDGTTSTTQTIGTTYPASGAFLGISSPTTGWNADVVYVDIKGQTVDNVYTGTQLKKPGEIAKHLLKNYPRVKTDIAAGFASTTVTLGFTQTLAPFDIPVASNASFTIGDVIKVKEGSNYFHAYVYAKPTNKLSVANLFLNGNTYTTAYTTAAVVYLVDKSGGVADNMLNHESFRLVDRKWRKKLASGVLSQRNGPEVAMLVESSSSVSDALNKITNSTFTYWYVNRLGRVSMGVPDFDASNQIENPGFENFTTTGVWPHKSVANTDGRTSMGNVTLTSTKRYEGQSAAKVENKNGSFEAVPNARAIAPVILPTPGTYAVTALIGLESGNGSAVRVGMSSPVDSKVVYISEPAQAINEEWRRVTTYFDTGIGNSGLTHFRFYPYNPDVPSPPTVPGGATLANWYKADEPNSGYDQPLDNTTVSTWYDKGASGNNLTATGAPKFIKDYCLGRSGIRYDAVDDSHYVISPTAYTQYTLFVVYALEDSYSTNRRTAVVTIGSGTEDLYLGTKAGTTNYTLEVKDGTSETLTGETTTNNIKTLKIHTVRVSGDDTKYWINSTLIGTSTSSRAPALGTFFGIGSNSYMLNGVVCEVMLYDRALGAVSRKSIENYLATKYGIDNAGIYVDNIEVTQIAGVLNDDVSNSLPLDFQDEIYPEARVTYNVNLQDSKFAQAIIFTDSQAKNLTSAVSEGKNAIQTSSRLDLGETTIVDFYSAAGIAAAAVAYFGRLRYTIKIKSLCPHDFIPDVGMKLLDTGMSRLPTSNADYPLFPITSIDYNNNNAVELDMSIEGQIDPVLDRGMILQDSMPLGTVLITRDTTGTPSYVGQFEEITELADKFVAGGSATDLVNEFGNVYHTHTADHDHEISNHLHSYTVTGVDSVSYDFWGVYGISPGNGSAGTASPTHTHTASITDNTNWTTGSSSSASVTMTTPPGPNTPSYIRVRFFRHLSDSGTPNIPTTLLFMYESNDVPNGWTRERAYNGYYLRGATTNNSFSGRTIASAFTPSDSGSWLTFNNYSDTDDMQVGKRLTVVNTTGATITFHVVVSEVDTINKKVKVYPLHEYLDSANVMIGTTNTTVAGEDERVNASATTVPNHDHADTIPSHTHTADHAHTPAVVSSTTTGPSDSVSLTRRESSLNICASSNHYHYITDLAIVTSAGGTIGSATGGTFSDTPTQVDGCGLIFMYSPGSNRLIPSGVIVFFDGTVCPNGWTRFANADDLLIFGTTGNVLETTVGGHTHTFTASAHTFVHNHGGTFNSATTGTEGTDGYKYDQSNPLNVGSSLDHSHMITGTIGNGTISGGGNASLEEATLLSTSAASSQKPRYKKLLLCKKN